MSRQENRSGRALGWGCLVVVIPLAVLGASLAVIFLWDVNGAG